MSDIKRVVLAYSGGLDTSVIAKWLEVERGLEVVTFTADLGQGEEIEPAREKARAMGIPDKHIYIEDLREEFVRDFVFPMMRANARYEGDYLLGTSIARPLISKRLVEIARETDADAIAHGATGKGNDQVRFELSAYALDPDITVIAPWREWDLTSRQGQARRKPVLDRCEPAAHLVRRQGTRGSVGRDPRLRLFAHRPSGKRARHPRIYRDRFREGRRRLARRQDHEPRHAARRA
jgi:hypothetical protein